MGWFDPITQPLAEMLAPLFGMDVETLKSYLDGILLLIVLIVAIILIFKIIKWFK